MNWKRQLDNLHIEHYTHCNTEKKWWMGWR